MCHDRMPSLEEQDAAQKYVMLRSLVRPDTDVKKVIKCVSVFLLSVFIFFAASYIFLDRFGIFSYCPESLCQFKAEHGILFPILYFLALLLISVIIVARSAFIGIVHLYQHYADENIRRRCLFMPTCSEYAILAVKKYGLIVGVILTATRLFRKCKGNIYRIDYP